MHSGYVKNRKDIYCRQIVIVGLKGNSTNFSKFLHNPLRCEQGRSEWFGVKRSVLEKLRVRVVHSGGDRNQTSTSKSFLTESYYMKWLA